MSRKKGDTVKAHYLFIADLLNMPHITYMLYSILSCDRTTLEGTLCVSNDSAMLLTLFP